MSFSVNNTPILQVFHSRCRRHRCKDSVADQYLDRTHTPSPFHCRNSIQRGPHHIACSRTSGSNHHRFGSRAAALHIEPRQSLRWRCSKSLQTSQSDTQFGHRRAGYLARPKSCFADTAGCTPSMLRTNHILESERRSQRIGHG